MVDGTWWSDWRARYGEEAERTPWPLSQKMTVDPTADVEVCIRHQKWFPCLGAHSRYDSDIRTCRVVSTTAAATWMRDFHNGLVTRPQLAEAYSHILDYREVENEAVIT